jgi:hypothetical protein
MAASMDGDPMTFPLPATGFTRFPRMAGGHVDAPGERGAPEWDRESPIIRR